MFLRNIGDSYDSLGNPRGFTIPYSKTGISNWKPPVFGNVIG